MDLTVIEVSDEPADIIARAGGVPVGITLLYDAGFVQTDKPANIVVSAGHAKGRAVGDIAPVLPDEAAYVITVDTSASYIAVYGTVRGSPVIGPDKAADIITGTGDIAVGSAVNCYSCSRQISKESAHIDARAVNSAVGCTINGRSTIRTNEPANIIVAT